ncbi:DUF5994 family protein [Mycobacterium ostraviense]|uniref:DUF5994 family protein n=1 Tax=Mycobacterium ostraviense TaxID=2738409 RepID=UPI000A61E180
MRLEQARKSFRQHDTPRVRTPRLRLKPKSPRGGHVDGAWWPRSDDLTTELPDLIAVLSLRLGEIDRVTYNVNEIEAPAQLTTGGRAVQLDGSHRPPSNTIEVTRRTRSKIILLVVPWYTAPDYAYGIVMSAAASNDASSVDTLLMSSKQDRESRTRATPHRGVGNHKADPNARRVGIDIALRRFAATSPSSRRFTAPHHHVRDKAQ